MFRLNGVARPFNLQSTCKLKEWKAGGEVVAKAKKAGLS